MTDCLLQFECYASVKNLHVCQSIVEHTLIFEDDKLIIPAVTWFLIFYLHDSSPCAVITYIALFNFSMEDSLLLKPTCPAMSFDSTFVQ